MSPGHARRFWLFVVAAVLSLGIVAQGVAEASAAVATSWTSGSRSIYTVPKSVDKKRVQTTLAEEYVRAIQATRSGATIRITNFEISIGEVVTKLIEAHDKRGVNVQFILRDGGVKKNPKFVRMLKKSLGTNINKPSFFTVCKNSCSLKGKDDAEMHAKIATFSSVVDKRGKVVRYVSFVGSENLSTNNRDKSWNGTQLITKCHKIYAALKSYFDTLKYDKTKRDYRSVTDCGYTLYLYPVVRSVLPMLSALEKMTCKAAKRTGIKGRSAGLFMVYMWANSQRRIAELLVKRHKEGCVVGVIITRDKTSKTIVNILRKGGVPTYDARAKNRFMHAKMSAISGTVNGKAFSRTWNGSQNFTGPSLDRSNEVVIAAHSNAAFKKAAAFFDAVKKFLGKKKRL